MNNVYLSIGSNTHPAENFRECLRLLRDSVAVVTVSPVYESAPMGEGMGVYWNAAAHIQTDLDPVTLKENILVEIEDALGRQRKQPAVTIDLDIVLFNREQYDFGKRQIPEPDILRYAHVALPLADIAPEYVYPVINRTLSDIAAGFIGADGKTDGITPITGFTWE